jgi:hypothetical protein
LTTVDGASPEVGLRPPRGGVQPIRLEDWPGDLPELVSGYPAGFDPADAASVPVATFLLDVSSEEKILDLAVDHYTRHGPPWAVMPHGATIDLAWPTPAGLCTLKATIQWIDTTSAQLSAIGPVVVIQRRANHRVHAALAVRLVWPGNGHPPAIANSTTIDVSAGGVAVIPTGEDRPAGTALAIVLSVGEDPVLAAAVVVGAELRRLRLCFSGLLASDENRIMGFLQRRAMENRR